MKSQRIRLKDVAEAAGVSRTTVSFVLNGRDESIAAETRRRVLEACRALGYQPHANARALATGRTNRIGIVMGISGLFNLENSYYNDTLRGAIAGAMDRGYNLLFHAGRLPDWRMFYEDITSGATDGVLLVGRKPDDMLAIALYNCQFPTVCISCEVDHPDCVSVSCDDRGGAYQAASHLLTLGHTQIAFFSYSDKTSWDKERHQGILEALADCHLSEKHLGFLAWEEEDPRKTPFIECAVEFIKHSGATAVIISDEEPARLLMEKLPEYGLQVPRDISIISFNSTEVSRRSHPPMTSVYQPLRRIGNFAAGKLIDIVENVPIECAHTKFPMKLHERESCAPLDEHRVSEQNRMHTSRDISGWKGELIIAEDRN
jgi:DNA-binding LacI/PurR family transcriptional regulator